MWLANYAIAKLQHSGEVMGFDEFLASVLEAPGTTPKKENKSNKKRTAEEIIADFAPFVAADRMRGG